MRILTDYFATLTPPVSYTTAAHAVGMAPQYAAAVDLGNLALLSSFRRALAAFVGVDESEIARRVSTVDARLVGSQDMYRYRRTYEGEPVDYRTPPAAAIADPLVLSGCQLWLSASLGVTVGGGNAVTAWANQGLQGGSFAPSGGSPTYMATGIAGKPAVGITTATTYMTSAIAWDDITTASAWTCFALVRMQDPGGTISGTSSTNASVLCGDEFSATFGFVGQVSGSEAMTVGAFVDDGADKSARTTVYPHRSVVLTSRFSAGNLTMQVNNGAVVTTAGVGSPTLPTGVATLFFAPARYLKARLRHLIVYNRALTDVEVLRVQHYLGIDGGV